MILKYQKAFFYSFFEIPDRKFKFFMFFTYAVKFLYYLYYFKRSFDKKQNYS